MGLDWGRAQRRDKRLELYREARLAAADPASYVWVDEEPDPRPRCLVCSKPTTPGGDEAHQLSSGSWVHDSCVRDVDEFLDDADLLDEPEVQDAALEAVVYEVDAEVSFSVNRMLLAESPEDARRQMQEWLLTIHPKMENLDMDALISRSSSNGAEVDEH